MQRTAEEKMRKIQKTTAIISVIVVLAAAALLGIFLWKENRDNKAGQPDRDVALEGTNQPGTENARFW